MQVQVSIDIQASPAAVWAIIADIDHAVQNISAIDSIEVLEPAKGPSLVGLKWKETRTMFGKAATEVMWVTEAEDDAFYQTRAESHGAIYVSRLELTPQGDTTTLTMGFEGTAVTFGSKVMWALTGWMAKGAMKKALAKDLEDIKAAAEA